MNMAHVAYGFFGTLALAWVLQEAFFARAPHPRPFRVGDVVMLKSGSPWMTIQEIAADGEVTTVIWYAAEGKSSGFFFPHELRRRSWIDRLFRLRAA